ncbi:xanthine dehydrogenase family protein molybdopterin-binding subunit [Aestuariicella hydrocarbonica]|uniref:Xanthine dehydrogenase family protein molybdopterin-binding subunit n=1 Tax=Pseudomaricurvus hydrocarbonicus TaxID=1470433 RepID=A0A9E5T215_9GAMM|nr:molybdopterin cofactor-binding domain-containing protein [Aestuariicella hydrocarbonica]NHO68025.1 xanthine dehydrogenase family protein molybdopterin-binding subunit [Aestuariicella hydrocarbonica]
MSLSQGRRQFLKLMGVAGGGLILGLPLTGCNTKPYPFTEKNQWQPDAFLQFSEQGDVRFFLPQAEMGQGVTMGLATLIAEELDMNPAEIQITHAGVHKDYVAPAMGAQITGGSSSIRVRYEAIRQSAATAKFLLLQAASQQLQVPVGELTLSQGQVHYSDQTAPMANFVAIAARLSLPEPEQVVLKDSKDFQWIGHDRGPRIDALAKVTGTAEFGIDVDIPGLKRAALKRCPVIGGKVKSFETHGAEAQPGVLKILTIDNGVAVLADHYWQARKALNLIEVVWDFPQLVQVSSSDIEQLLTEGLKREGEEAFTQGQGAEGLTAARKTLKARYQVPYVAHATMEPMNCVVHLQGQRGELWVPTQAPDVAQAIMSEHSGIDRDKIQVHSTYLGGGFGRRGFHDFVAEATQIAKLSGEPVQLIWNREDDTQNDYYRPAAMADFEAGLDTNGQLQSWTVKRAGPNVLPYMFDEAMGAVLPDFLPQPMVEWASKRGYGIFDGWTVDSSSIEGLYEDYTIEHKEVRHVTVDPGLRCGFWRAVGHSFSGFFAESFMDELATLAGEDPLTFRLRHLDDNPRLKHVLSLAAEKAGWGAPKPGRFLGLAAVASFQSYVAEVAEVSVDNGQIKVHKVTCAVDCGRVVNPDMVRTQMEGGIIYGLTAALYSEITLKNGAVEQGNFHDYPMLRMLESPDIDVHMVDSEEPPTGVGEPGLPPIAPAVANAVFAATAQRLRRLPLKLA